MSDKRKNTTQSKQRRQSTRGLEYKAQRPRTSSTTIADHAIQQSSIQKVTAAVVMSIATTHSKFTTVFAVIVSLYRFAMGDTEDFGRCLVV
jgi:hypothetical protein